MTKEVEWLAVVGTREVDDRIRADIEQYVGRKITEGLAIVSGGATGADHETARLAYGANLDAEKFRIFLPTSLDIYCDALKLRASQGKCDVNDAQDTIRLLKKIAIEKPSVIRDMTPYNYVNAESFHVRNQQIVARADELVAFRVNQSAGTTYTIHEAQKKGVDVKVFDY